MSVCPIHPPANKSNLFMTPINSTAVHKHIHIRYIRTGREGAKLCVFSVRAFVRFRFGEGELETRLLL